MSFLPPRGDSKTFIPIKCTFCTADYTIGLLSHAKFGSDWLKGLLGTGAPDQEPLIFQKFVKLTVFWSVFASRGDNIHQPKFGTRVWRGLLVHSKFGPDGQTGWTWEHQISKFGQNRGILAFLNPLKVTSNRKLHFAHTVHPFSPTDNVAYRQRARGGLSHKHRQHAQKIWQRSHVWFRRYLVDRMTYRHTDAQTDITILHNCSCGQSNNIHRSSEIWRERFIHSCQILS